MADSIEIPSIRLDREAFGRIKEGAMVVLSLLSFWIMAAAETSHHTEYHYKFYPSLTFFVWVGVLSFLYSLGLAAGKFTGVLNADVVRQMEVAVPPVMVWLTYTAAIAASATSTDLHTTFDENDGPVCRARQSHARALAGAYFCGHVVAAVVFMYCLCAAYVAVVATNVYGGGGFVSEVGMGMPESVGRGGFAGSTGYDEIATGDAPPAPQSHQQGGQAHMNL